MGPAASRPAEAGAVGVPDARETDDAYQRRLALRLVASVGVDAALRYCRNNSWDGVLRAVLALPRTDRA